MKRLLFAAVVALVAVPASGQEGVPLLDVVGTTFRVSTGDGRVVEGVELSGAVLSMAFDGAIVRARIASIEADPGDTAGEILLHDVRLIADDGSERPLCRPDPQGRTVGFPLAGRTDSTGALRAGEPGAFEFVCTAGAQGKCVRFGYAPWRVDDDGRSLADHYNACVHMVRADYCGDGRTFTRDGMRIGFADRIGINTDDGGEIQDGLRFEAAWGPDGALCVARPRLEALDSTATLAKACPGLIGRLGPDQCDPARTDALIVNYSR